MPQTGATENERHDGAVEGDTARIAAELGHIHASTLLLSIHFGV